jgi:hypothetical protein
MALAGRELLLGGTPFAVATDDEVRTMKTARSPLVLTLALAIGLLVQVFGGALAGVVAAVLGAGVGTAIVRHQPDEF